jgi:hypothetical protein
MPVGYTHDGGGDSQPMHGNGAVSAHRSQNTPRAGCEWDVRVPSPGPFSCVLVLRPESRTDSKSANRQRRGCVPLEWAPETSESATHPHCAGIFAQGICTEGGEVCLRAVPDFESFRKSAGCCCFEATLNDRIGQRISECPTQVLRGPGVILGWDPTEESTDSDHGTLIDQAPSGSWPGRGPLRCGSSGSCAVLVAIDP